MAKTEPLPHFNNNLRITGPYLNKKQGRRFVTITNLTSGKITQKTYAKYLMEVYISRELSKEETVDHIDRNKLNDVVENFRVVSPELHSTEDSVRAKNIKKECVWCGVEVSQLPKYTRMRAKENNAGPFCGAVCRGKYGAHISHGGKRLPTQIAVDTEFYYSVKE